MKTFDISYFYLASGMEGLPDTQPKVRITAVDRDHAIHQYVSQAWPDPLSFYDFMRQSKAVREWGLTVTEVSEVKTVVAKRNKPGAGRPRKNPTVGFFRRIPWQHVDAVTALVDQYLTANRGKADPQAQAHSIHGN